MVLVSCDRSEDQFNKSAQDMPWVAVPLSTNKDKIFEILGVKYIPHPCIVNGSTGNIIEVKADRNTFNDAIINDWIAKC